MHISDSACKINMNLNQDRSWMGSRAPREGRGKPFQEGFEQTEIRYFLGSWLTLLTS